ncbi:DNA recombination protein RmuC [Propionispora vibrioides]|uniref:DNA recombination protein RmuC n=1 Tax=Propionispora vibrioides TaxID=112903 RepID=A0A1H8PXA6_9FIRM|nr:DNA recombination protein RmuC [Propionispora vibrioides]SEO46575.1 DNA recombination protein RmuC [Propionispora vibrioides]
MTEIALFISIGINLIGLIVLLLISKQQGGIKKQDIMNALASLEKGNTRTELIFKDEIRRNREEMTGQAALLRQEVAQALGQMNESILQRLNEQRQTQLQQGEAYTAQLQTLIRTNESKLEHLRDTVEQKLQALQQDNSQKLEEMRRTVDEKLHETLERRLGESFRLVSERLELVHKGLGEMQVLASGVGDLKRVLTNVKTRGIWGEIQLGNLLEQILTIEQYERNVATKPGSNERVEFAIRLPGRDQAGSTVWLPIDAKFPQEDYQRLLDAQEAADLPAAEEAGKALESRIKLEAREISEKYLCVPHTTDFAILFLPIEGLYAEVLRRPGLCDQLMQRHKVIITGPTTLAALLNSLQMGFRTLAIEKRSSEVWALLGAVKSEFGKFGDLLEKTHKKLQEASNSIDTAARKSRTIERKLKAVEELPPEQAMQLLEVNGPETEPY